MNRIDRRYAELAASGRCGLIPFITAGDPHPDWTVDVMHALVSAGADLIELGVPFSDPMADGPVIQRASERALARGVGLAKVLAMVRAFRERDASTPVVLMGYLNPLEIYGYARFAADAAAAGADGVLMVDSPVEEADELSPVLEAAHLHQIFLAAPTTTATRLAAVKQRAHGFIYYVSFTGITGADHLALDPVAGRVADMKRDTAVPVAVGFGVKEPAQAARIAGFADAVVIGSALVEQLAPANGAADAVARATAFLAPMRTAIDGARASRAA
jgi:tryptophan synthase alpha chain